MVVYEYDLIKILNDWHCYGDVLNKRKKLLIVVTNMLLPLHDHLKHQYFDRS